MSRRDSVINALLGVFLLSVFFACLAAIALVGVFGFLGFRFIFGFVFPGVTQPFNISATGILAFGMIVYGVRHARKGRWRNALLFFAVAPIAGWGLNLAERSSVTGFGGSWLLCCWLPFVMVMSIADEAVIGWRRLFLAAAIISAEMLVSGGLLGNTAVAHSAAYGLFGVTIIWLSIDIVRNRHKTKIPDQSPVLPPTAA